MRLVLPALFLLLLKTPDAYAQPVCPNVHFKTVSTASLIPSATTRLNLVLQADGSYSSYQTANSSPYKVVSETPNFQEQFTACLPTAAATQRAPAASLVGVASQTQAVAVLSSGNYLIVTPNSSEGIDAAVFGPQMNLVSVASYAVLGQQLALADVNGDGNPDIVATTNGTNRGPGQVSVLLGEGGSRFQSPNVFSIPPDLTAVDSFAIGDINGDGKLDVAMAVSNLGGTAGNLMTFLGNGAGTFTSGPTTALANLTVAVGSTTLALADLNGDGTLDAVENLDGYPFPYIAVLSGKGDGSFGTPSYIAVAGGSVAIGDMNGDGIPDVVTIGSILFGDGTGAFPIRQDYNVPAAGAVILADFNADGRLDVVIAGGIPALLTEVTIAGSVAPAITVLFGQADGSYFGPPVSIGQGPKQVTNLNTDLRAADFNGDGIPDIAYAKDTGLGAMLGKGDGTFTSSYFYSAGPGGYLASGDFNRDGNQDIVSLVPYLYFEPSESSFISFFGGNGDGTFQAPVPASISGSPAAFAAGDFNQDGKLDLAVMSSTQNFGSTDGIDIYLGNGDGTFSPGETYPSGPATSWILAGDLNGDGIPDLVVTSSGSQTQPGSVSTFLAKGDGTFIPGTTVPLAVQNSEGYTGTMTLKDFNGDGRLDLAVDTTTGVVILLGHGDGTFQTPLTTSLSGGLAAADLNGDGVPDLIGPAGPQGCPVGFCYELGNGDGTFQSPIGINAGLGGTPLISDLNHDGKPDLVCSAALPLSFFGLLNLSTSDPFQVASAAGFAPGPVAPNSIVAAFGSNLPGSTSGLSITVTDSAGVSRAATALYASSTQINFVIPAGTGVGLANVAISGAGAVAPLVAPVHIAPVAAGLFTENAAGLVAAYAVIVDAEGNQSIEPALSVQNGTVVASPISLGSSTDRAYLSLFGTGFDAASSASVSVAVAGQSVPVSYAGTQGSSGLDQVNVLLPHTLAGSGDSPVVLFANGSAANAVRITIQ